MHAHACNARKGMGNDNICMVTLWWQIATFLKFPLCAFTLRRKAQTVFRKISVEPPP